ncbi:hypothetical protein BDV59DRAFT_199687 [Aspergillus ambiguus]|uniref:uncharacterized protein n=1 Tax=Aspergillus ambiguus TaxID=176160 RepID=UPI003CCDDD47
MYSSTPTNKFLVLAPIQSGPRSIDIDMDTPPQFAPKQAAASIRDRSASQSSTATQTVLNDAVPSLPNSFLYLGHDLNRAGTIPPPSIPLAR